MRIGRYGLIGVLAALLTVPAAAQTTQSTAKPAASAPAASTAAKPAALVDINTASAEDLDKLPGIGKSRADAIIKNRPYKGKDDLTRRNIIPSNIYDGIKDKIIAKQG